MHVREPAAVRTLATIGHFQLLFMPKAWHSKAQSRVLAHSGKYTIETTNLEEVLLGQFVWSTTGTMRNCNA